MKFKEKFDLPFTLLADDGHHVADEYGVWTEKSYTGRTYMGVERSTFVIAEDGTVKKVLRNVKPATHADDVLAVLAELSLGERDGLFVAPLGVVVAEPLAQRALELAARLELLDDVGAADQLALRRTPAGSSASRTSRSASCLICGSGRMSTAVTGAPARRRACRARSELPHITNDGVPFMKSATSEPSIRS